VVFIDFAPLKACRSRRIYSRKVFSGLAGRGKTSTGWFCGFKLHLVVSEHGEILSFFLTASNVEDCNADLIDRLCGGTDQKTFRGPQIYLQGAFPGNCTGRGCRVKNLLKNRYQVEHAEHRSIVNFLVNLLATVAAYGFLPRKPSIHRGTSSPVPVG